MNLICSSVLAGMMDPTKTMMYDYPLCSDWLTVTKSQSESPIFGYYWYVLNTTNRSHTCCRQKLRLFILEEIYHLNPYQIEVLDKLLINNTFWCRYECLSVCLLHKLPLSCCWWLVLNKMWLKHFVWRRKRGNYRGVISFPFSIHLMATFLGLSPP